MLCAERNVTILNKNQQQMLPINQEQTHTTYIASHKNLLDRQRTSYTRSFFFSEHTKYYWNTKINSKMLQIYEIVYRYLLTWKTVIGIPKSAPPVIRKPHASSSTLFEWAAQLLSPANDDTCFLVFTCNASGILLIDLI